MSALELGRLFSLMEGVDPEGLFNAALRMTGGGGGDLGGAAGGGLPPQLQGLEGLAASHLEGGMRSAANVSGNLQEGGGSTDEEDSRGSVPGRGTGGDVVPPRTGAINDRKCTKVLPASSSAPKYKFVVPNEYVYKFMQHLVERPFHMRDPSGKLWDCVLIQRKNKEKYEYMIQGWRKFGEATGVHEGDTVTIEMVDDTTMQLTMERGSAGPAGGSSGKKRQREARAGGSQPPQPLAMQQHGGGYGERLLPRGGSPSPLGLLHGEHGMEQKAAELLQAQGLLGPPRQQGGTQQQQQGLARQQHTEPPRQQGYPDGLGDQPGGGTQGLLALIQQQQAQQQARQQQAAQAAQQQAQQQAMGGGQGGRGATPPVITPRSLSQHLANGLAGPLGQLAAGGNFNGAQLADLTALISNLDKRQRGGSPPVDPQHGGAPPAGGGSAGGQVGAIRLLSDVADVESLMQENMGLREELRMTQAKIATLETGVLNIKSVLTRNTDPGLIAMTGVINLLNQMESPDFLPELGTIGRMTLTGLCSAVRRHLNGVLRMVWILRSLPDDVQQHNLGSAPVDGSGAGP